ncbi:hypothetical protein FRB94_005060 [Tulasnella sp. JGI-2019a]|nr:hypothetical protein FRB94_005060 [Tulasnella sp. JGI-2019a]
MLPVPASASHYAKRKNKLTSIHNAESFFTNLRFDRASLLARSRATNLAVFLLTGALVISLTVHIQTLLRYSTPDHGHASSAKFSTTQDALEAARIPKSIYGTVAREERLTKLSHLIIVAGHAVFTGCSPEERLDEDHWILEDRQRGGGNIEAFFKHIEQGAKMTIADNSSLLLFSGGQTRPKTLITEAQSYHQLAILSHLLKSPGEHRAFPSSRRVSTENFALDSFQNLLFSIARFREITGAYPERITVVGFGMKRRRFEELHRKAIRWPEENFDYVGIDVKGDTSMAYAGENQFGFTPYSKDLYGCHDELLAKRRRRNPFQIFHPYHTSAPEMAGLFEWCPPGNRKTEVYPGWLPWAPT